MFSMELTLDQALQKAIAAHKEGELQDAERLYRAILQTRPKHPDANHNLGVLAVDVGKPLDALPLFKLALETTPKVEQFWLSYVDALMKVERFQEAERVLVEGKKLGVLSEKSESLRQQILTASPSKDSINDLMGLYQSRRWAEVEELALSFTRRFPKHPFGWKALGVTYQQLGRFEDSLAPLQTSAELLPTDAETHSNLGNTLKELGRLADAEASYLEAILLEPHYSEAHYNLGSTLKAQGRSDEAVYQFGQAISLKPNFAVAHHHLGITLQELGRLEEAKASYIQAIASRPAYAEVHVNLGNALKELGRFDEAIVSYRRAIALEPKLAEAHYNLGNTLKDLGRTEEALAEFGQAITLRPDYAKAHHHLGATLQELGRLEEAEASYIQAIENEPAYAEAHRSLAYRKKFRFRDDHFLQMRALYYDPNTSHDDRCYIAFALAKASEDIEDFASAFQLYEAGNALRKERLGYDKEGDTELFKKFKAVYPSLNAQSLDADFTAPEHIPIFIVGMPRSGTTLIEQIISSHPQVTGAGELLYAFQFGAQLATSEAHVNEQALRSFRSQYLSALRQHSYGNGWVTDKMPHNFRFLGLITAAIPEAKIIHVKRDPAAVCWAHYSKLFAKHALEYSYSLDDILHYHRLYEDLMNFWHQALPSSIYDLHYEVLTEDQESQTRRLLGYLGLEWDDSCLSPEDNKRGVATASNVQVRQRVYQGSSEKWKRYRPYLDGALDHFSAGNN